MRDIANLRKKAKDAKEKKKPPMFTGGETQIDLMLDSAADQGNYSISIPGRLNEGIIKKYEDEGYKIFETNQGVRIYFSE